MPTIFGKPRVYAICHFGDVMAALPRTRLLGKSSVVNRWDEKAGLRRDAVRSQVIDVL
jgi:hypothetical protein